MSDDALLDISELTRRFGGLVAVDAVSLSVGEREIVSLIGPNGAGKTTAFNCITGLHSADAGSVRFAGGEITGLAPHRISQRGIGRTFQNIRLFTHMSVLDNVMVGEHASLRGHLWDSILRTPAARREERDARDRGLDVLRRLGLERHLALLAGQLPYGLQRRLEIARALASGPRLLLLDEPAAGLNPQEKRELMELVSDLRAGGLTILLIEHDMRVVMGVSDRVVVLDHGERIATGAPAEIRRDPRVIEAYLGRGAAAEVAG